MTLTENAIRKFKEIITESGNRPARLEHSGGKAGVRFYTIPGCCSPLLKMEIADSPAKGDVVVEIGGVDFYISNEADNLLSGLSIDFSNGKFISVKPEN